MDGLLLNFCDFCESIQIELAVLFLIGPNSIILLDSVWVKPQTFETIFKCCLRVCLQMGIHVLIFY